MITGRALLLTCALLAGCAPGQQLRAAEPVLDLPLARADGSVAGLSDLLGRPTLLFLFATYDASSQFAITPIVQFLEQEHAVQVLGVALQPDARAFLDPYRRSLDLPFSLYYDPENRLLQGKTALGKVDTVPSFVALDAEGHIRSHYVGAASTAQLRTLAASASH